MRVKSQHPAVLQKQDFIRIPDARHAVRDKQDCLILCKFHEPVEHQKLRLGIQRRGRLVQDQDVGVPVKCARKRKLLPLPARQFPRIAKPLSEHLSARYGICHVIYRFIRKPALSQRSQNVLVRLLCAFLRECDILTHSQIKSGKVLKHGAELPSV